MGPQRLIITIDVGWLRSKPKHLWSIIQEILLSAQQSNCSGHTRNEWDQTVIHYRVETIPNI